MQRIELGSTGRATTQLGFGGSSIMGVLNRRQSLDVLESAFDAGIRHFDTAPMYGYGEAESCLGEFLSRHRGEVTVTTKFGIPPAKKSAAMRAGRAFAGPVLQRFPALKRQLQRGPQAGNKGEARGVAVANPIFNAEAARASLEKSLAALKTDRIDVWLLHDVKAIDLAENAANDGLLRVLEDAVREGKVGLFGVGSDREVIPELVKKRPEYCAALQYEWSVLNQLLPKDSRLRIHHRTLSQNFSGLVEKLREDSKRCRRWSEEIDADLADSDVLARLMLKAACVMNPESILLFSSKRAENIRKNVMTVEDVALEAAAQRFYEVVQRDMRGSE